MNYDEILGINQSTLKHFHNPKSMAHALLASKKKFDNETLSFGRLVHSLILEPELFESQYIVADKPDYRTTAGKQRWAELQAGAASTQRQLVPGADFDCAVRMRNSLSAHRVGSDLLTSYVAEPAQRQIEQLLTGVVEDEDGVQHAAKGRADCILLDVYTQPVIVDLKTTDDASAKGFSDSCAKYAYHLQAAFYVDLLAAAGQPDAKFIFVAVEKSAPYGVQVFEADDEFIRMGRIAYKRALKLYALCKKLDLTLQDIPAYSENIEQLSLPRWA